MDQPYAVRTSNLTKCFCSEAAVAGCSMTVAQGTIYGILGPNGAGKTTLFKLLTGMLVPDSGKIEVLGLDMPKNRNSLLAAIGSLIEAPVFYEHLSARKNLELHLAYMNVSGAGIEKALEMTGLSGVGEKEVSKFSLGMRQRLGIARAFIHQPRLLILDEPVNGLDPMGIREMRELFVSLSRDCNMTILISSHIVSEIEHVADKIGVIADGNMICESDLIQIKKEYKGSLEDYFFNLFHAGTAR